MVSVDDEQSLVWEDMVLKVKERERRKNCKGMKEEYFLVAYAPVHEGQDFAHRWIVPLHLGWALRRSSVDAVTGSRNRIHWRNFCTLTKVGAVDMTVGARNVNHRMHWVLCAARGTIVVCVVVVLVAGWKNHSASISDPLLPQSDRKHHMA